MALDADDFGRSATINAADMQAYREGVLASASLMAAVPAAEEAVALARVTPGLAVRLHLVVVSRPACVASSVAQPNPGQKHEDGP